MMDRIPLKEAIEADAWFECQSDDVHCRIQFLSFEKVDFNEIDDVDEIDLDAIGNGILWILKLEVVNISKVAISPGSLRRLLLIVDADDFQFGEFSDSHLGCFSDYAEKSGLHQLFGQELRPKIKVKGAMTFLLPDEETEYYIAIEEGTIQEA